MKLTATQLCEVFLALNCGLSAAAWEGASDRPWWELSDEEKTAVLASVRAAEEELIRRHKLDFGPDSLNRQFLDRMTLVSVQNEERQEREARERLLNAAAPRRGSASGMRQAINDLLSQVGFFGLGQQRAVSRRLARRNLPTLEMLSAMLRKKHEKILQRGRVRNEEEYYLVQEILASVDFPIEDEDRQQLSALAGEYESRRKSR
jgi:hypothetical protein